MSLKWNEIRGGTLHAMGDEQTYLITSDDHGVVMTRFRSITPVTTAAEAALNAIAVSAYSESDQATAITRLKAMAAQFERGEDVFAQPRWRQPDERN